MKEICPFEQYVIVSLFIFKYMHKLVLVSLSLLPSPLRAALLSFPSSYRAVFIQCCRTPEPTIIVVDKGPQRARTWPQFLRMPITFKIHAH